MLLAHLQCRGNNYESNVFIERPLLGSLLFDNTDSDARDHCAAERSMSPPLSSPAMLDQPVTVPSSFPLLAPVGHLHGHRGGGHPHLLPPETPAVLVGEKGGPAVWLDLLAAGHRLPGVRSVQLHQDRHSLFETTGHRPDRSWHPGSELAAREACIAGDTVR